MADGDDNACFPAADSLLVRVSGCNGTNVPGGFNNCNRSTGAGCTIVPNTDDNAPATFYPFYSITRSSPFGGSCRWFIGNDVPGLTANDFGGVTQYGTLFPQTFLVFGGAGATHTVIDDYQNNLGRNPCPA